MKKFFALFLISLFLMLIGMPAIAQDARLKNYIKGNMISPIARTGSFFFERVISDYLSLQLGFLYTGATFRGVQIRGFSFTPELRYYISEKHLAPRGIFIAPFARYRNFNLEEGIHREAFSSIGGGLLVGVQILLRTASMDAWVGPSYNAVIVDGEVVREPVPLIGFGVRFGITVGIGF